MRIRLTPKYLLAFMCLACILGIGHELAHHVAGFLICGEWGYRTFNSFKLAAGCQQNHPDTYWRATFVGPLIGNYIPIWIGFARMRRPGVGSKRFGATLVFASTYSRIRSGGCPIWSCSRRGWPISATT
jgi:hypothetical protein